MTIIILIRKSQIKTSMVKKIMIIAMITVAMTMIQTVKKKKW